MEKVSSRVVESTARQVQAVFWLAQPSTIKKHVKREVARSLWVARKLHPNSRERQLAYTERKMAEAIRHALAGISGTRH